MKFQIRDNRFGLAIQEADSAADALADFVSDRAKGDTLAHAETADNGVASITFAGRKLYACPPGTETSVPNSGASG